MLPVPSIARRWVLTVVSLGALLGVVPAGAAHAVAGNPVLVVGGYQADQAKLDDLVAYLSSQGHPAYSTQLAGNPAGTAGIAQSAQVVADRVAAIRAATGAARVDVVGHSMGGLAQRHYIKFLGGLAQTGTYVSVGTAEKGDALGWACYVYQGCRDLVPGSAFLNQLNAAPAVPPGLPAYHLYSEQGTGEKEPLPGAANASVQAYCAGRVVQHADEPVDRAMQQLIVSALRGGPLATTCPA
ncbi:esterase/lipase family protein [Actinomadura flavalba]|uniref:esterase/lipase family protein n=1 Tax=Actinomadura flavalba TaxID=1120938 RepID=UPI0012DF335C|nr:alpha/beta hydrolase [Actinomadura flavalba]